MKDYIVEAEKGLTDDIRADVQRVLDRTGGKVVRPGDGGYLMLVNASEEAIEEIKALKGVSLVQENKVRIVPRPDLRTRGPKF